MGGGNAGVAWIQSQWQRYRNAGGKLSFSEWQSAGMPGPPEGGTVDSTGAYVPLRAGGSASDMLANITKATYEDWKSQYLPIALQMTDQTTYNNPGLVTEAVNAATATTRNAYDAAYGVRDRTLSRYGVAQSAQEQAVNAQRNETDKTASVVDAANRIRRRLADRNRTIALGGIPNLAAKNYGGED